jgi:hypothetical protein
MSIVLFSINTLDIDISPFHPHFSAPLAMPSAQGYRVHALKRTDRGSFFSLFLAHSSNITASCHSFDPKDRYPDLNSQHQNWNRICFFAPCFDDRAIQSTYSITTIISTNTTTTTKTEYQNEPH